MTQVDCIITAAGLSSRMKQWKMILPLQGGTILDASIKNALQFCSRVILITGYRADELHSRYANQENVHLVHNPHYTRGLYSSIKAAAGEVSTDFCFITHGDLPCLNHEIFSKIWSLRGDYALMPCHNGTPGHPILLPRHILFQTIAQPDNHSMRQALLAGKHYSAEIDAAEITFDVDTPEDYIALQKR